MIVAWEAALDSRVLVRLSSDVRCRLEALAQRDGRSLSEYVRVMLERHAASSPLQAPISVGGGKSMWWRTPKVLHAIGLDLRRLNLGGVNDWIVCRTCGMPLWNADALKNPTTAANLDLNFASLTCANRCNKSLIDSPPGEVLAQILSDRGRRRSQQRQAVDPLSLAAGTLLDEIVAERVMGWHSRDSIAAESGEEWIDPEGRLHQIVPRFSTDRDAVRAVLAQVASWGWTIEESPVLVRATKSRGRKGWEYAAEIRDPENYSKQVCSMALMVARATRRNRRRG
jgi:hypothetical protein